MRSRPIAMAVDATAISGVTASTGRSRSPRINPACSRYAAPRAASGPGLPRSANTTTSSTANMGAAAGGRNTNTRPVGDRGGLGGALAPPPQELVGVGFTAQGNFAGSYYRLKPG